MNLLSKLSPYALVILGTLCTTLVVAVTVLGFLYKNALDTIAEKEIQLQLSQASLLESNKQIEDQNKKIKELELTPEQKDKLSKDISNTVIEYRDKIIYVEKELSKDNSCENQIRVIDNVLKEFSNESITYSP